MKWPLNASRKFEPWNAVEAQDWLDFNPTVVRLGEDCGWVIFRREQLPPVPGQGSLWAVAVDKELRPVAQPFQLLVRGEDPRAIAVGDRVLVFYVLPEMSEEGKVVGTSMAMAEFTADSENLLLRRHFKLPKAPLAGLALADAIPGWEKNWVPFYISDSQVGLIYAHQPWHVLVLDVDPQKDVLGFLSHHPAKGLHWGYGPIRGGTPPLRFDEAHLVTFFHAAVPMGSRKLYTVGACVFEKNAPFRPVMFTAEPLLVAPHCGSVAKFGWSHASYSVVFPLGAEACDEGWRLLCGIDDGEIGSFLISRGELLERLSPMAEHWLGTLHNYLGQATPYDGGPLLHVPVEVGGIAELPIIKCIQFLAGKGRTFVDVGAHIGFYTAFLAPGFDRVESYEPSRFQHSWLLRNVHLNGFEHVDVHASALGEAAGEAVLRVLSSDGGINTLAEDVAVGRPALQTYKCPVQRLDDRGLVDVDLLKIDVEGFELPVLRGARNTISNSRPVVLLEVWDEASRREPIVDWFRELDYCIEFLFPTAPELALCLPRERRQQYAWFLGS